MAITTRYAVNMALQYNEVTLDEFLINPSVGSRRFLTEAEQTRLLRATETSALYFLTDVSGAGRSVRYRWYDSGGALLNEYLLDLSSAGVHNSIPIDWTSFDVPVGAVKITVAIVNASQLFLNSDFSLGTGNLFTSWTLTKSSDDQIIENTTGGIGGGRCLEIFADNGEIIYFRQSVNLVSGRDYTIEVQAKYLEEGFNGYLEYKIGAGSWTAFESLLTDTYASYSAGFTAVATASTAIYFRYINDMDNGYASIDDAFIAETTPSELSEIRTYLLDDECTSYEYELNWLNKLGGRDTWVFTGYPVEQVEVKRNNEIEYSRRTNLTAPNRIYAYRENKSRKTLTVVHRCKTRATADWLKSELIDSIDVLIKVGTDYYPANVQAASTIVFNPFTQDYVVRVSLQYAFDINVQTR